MFHNIMLGRYFMTGSKIHTMNPISKILCILIFMMMVFATTSLELNVLLIILTYLFLLLTNIPIINYLRTAKLLIPFYVILLLVGIIFQIPFMDNLFIMIRITLLLFYITMLTLTTPITEIIYGFEKILSFLNIFNIRVFPIALSITESILLIPMMIDEGSRILKSAVSRGLQFESVNLKRKILTLRSMITPIWLLTEKKLEDFQKVMSLRLYNTSKTRTNFRMHRWGPFDTYMVMIYLLLLIAIIKKEILG